MRTLGELKKYNTITIEGDYSYVYDYMKSVSKTKEDLGIEIYCPFKQFVIKQSQIMNDRKDNTTYYITNYVYIEDHKDYIFIEYYIYSKVDYFLKQSLAIQVTGVINNKFTYKTLVKDCDDNEFANFIRYEELMMLYIIYIKDNPIIKYKTVKRGRRVKIQNNANDNHTQKRTSVLKIGEKTIYTIEGDGKDITNFRKHTYNRHKDSWEVQGHYRRYKNGKVVFIQGYVKGKKDGQTSKKDLVIKKR